MRGRNVCRAGLVLGVMAAIAPSVTAQPTVELQVIPASARVTREGNVNVLLILRNHRPQDVYLTDLGVLPPAENVTLAAKLPRHMAASSAASLQAVITTTGGMPVEGSVTLWTEWSEAPGDAPFEVTAVEIPLEERDPPAVADALDVAVRSTATDLNDQRSGHLSLVVKNVSSDRVRLTAIEARAPTFVRVCYLHPADRGVETSPSPDEELDEPPPIESCPRSKQWTFPSDVETADPGGGRFPGSGPLQPRQARIYEFRLSVEGRVQPGKHVAVFSVTGHREGSPNRQGTVVLSHEFTVSVLGQEELLGPLGVTSFLLLPGFLMIVVFGLMWRYVHPKKDFSLTKDLKTPELWLAVIGLSAVAAVVFRVARGYTYLSELSSGDLVLIWVGSVLAGVLLWAGVRAVAGGRRRADPPSESS